MYYFTYILINLLLMYTTLCIDNNSPDKKLHTLTAVIKKFQNRKYSLESHLNIAYPC